MILDEFIGVMDSFVGIKENPPGSNRTPIGVEYGYNGVAWCAETISVACRRLGFPLHEAAVIRIEGHARAGDWGMGWTRTPTRGAAVCFDWNGHGNPNDMHVGVLRDILDGGRFRTIEGNYHDSCQHVIRDMTFVRGFATFPFQSAPTPAPVPQPTPSPTQNNVLQFEESDMQYKECTVDITPADKPNAGNGWFGWDTGSPVKGCISGKWGPFPPDDTYHDDQTALDISAQRRGNLVIVTVRNAPPGGQVVVPVIAIN